MQMLRSVNAKLALASAAHALTWIPGLFLAFGPAYTGSDGFEPHTRTLIEVSGLYGVFVIFVPILLTGVVLWAVWRRVASERFLWGIALGLVVLCVLAAASIGMLYVPAALALVIAAAIGSVK